MVSQPESYSGIDAAEFEGLRPYLFAIAYRMVGSASEAEDIVQDAYLRAREATEPIRSAKAFLATIVTRLSLNHLNSARVSREAYPGQWLPEPVLTADADPAGTEAVARGDDVSLAFLLMLERLTPDERAAYVLREAFDYPYDEIAPVLGKSVTATRQLAHRARTRISEARPRFTASPDRRRQLTERFLAASRLGDLPALMDVLAADVMAWADGGAKRPQATRVPILGRDQVAEWLVLLRREVFAGTEVEIASLNGGPALTFWDGDSLRLACVVEATDDGISEVRVIVNPDKLAFLERRLRA